MIAPDPFGASAEAGLIEFSRLLREAETQKGPAPSEEDAGPGWSLGRSGIGDDDARTSLKS